MQIHAIETAYREREDHLNEPEHRVRDVGEGHFATSNDTHLGDSSLILFISLLAIVSYLIPGYRIDLSIV